MNLPDEPLPPSKQKIGLCNNSSHPIEVMVECVPNRYVLQSKDTLILIADAANSPRVEGYTLNVYDGGVQIYTAWDIRPEAYINGFKAKADWVTPTTALAQKNER